MVKVFDFDGTLVKQNSSRDLVKRMCRVSLLVFLRFVWIKVRELVLQIETTPYELYNVFLGVKIEIIQTQISKLIFELDSNQELLKLMKADSIIVSNGLLEVITYYKPCKEQYVIAYSFTISEGLVIGVNDNGLRHGKYFALRRYTEMPFIYYTDDYQSDLDICSGAAKYVLI